MLKVIVIISLIANMLTALLLVMHSQKYGGVIAVIEKIVSNRQKGKLLLSPQYPGRVDLLKGLPAKDTQIIMLGDSITEGGEWQEFFPNCRIVNRGIGQDTVQGVLDRVESYLKNNPGKIFLLIGINDLLHGGDVVEVSNNVKDLINLISIKSPGTKLIIQSVLPCREDLVANHKIKLFNDRLREEARKRNASFIDLYSQFINKNGEPSPTLFLSDGIHLSTYGYMVWIEILKPFISM